MVTMFDDVQTSSSKIVRNTATYQKPKGGGSIKPRPHRPRRHHHHCTTVGV